jgi:NAD(P)-dependent dehydrogenase (short-subunit alcohol dehydrogenase family)
MAARLKGKVALVVGAGSIGPGWGNGMAAAVTFAREGARVFCADINLPAAEETAGIIKGEGGDAVAHRADVSKAADVAAMIEPCATTCGRIDVLDNNVGIAEVGGVVELPEADWDRVFAINLKSAYLTMKYVIPIMNRQGGGSIINISSIASIRYTGVPYATYYATKAALNQLTRITAAQYAKQRIRVNAILPGLLKTPMVEKSAALAKSYGGDDAEEMWRVRDCQVPMDSVATPGTSPGRRSIWQATRAATRPASSSWSTAPSRSNTRERTTAKLQQGTSRVPYAIVHATAALSYDKR